MLVSLNRHLINQNTLHSRMNLLHLNMDLIFAHCYNYADEESQEFLIFVGLWIGISSLAGPINVSVHLKYDFLYLWVFVYAIPA